MWYRVYKQLRFNAPWDRKEEEVLQDLHVAYRTERRDAGPSVAGCLAGALMRVFHIFCTRVEEQLTPKAARGKEERFYRVKGLQGLQKRRRCARAAINHDLLQ